MGKDIKVYRSVWKSILLILCCFAFIAIGVLILHDEDSDGLKGFVVAWVCIPLSGLGALIIAYKVIKERLLQMPFLVITDKKIVMNDLGTCEIPFADVEAFFLTYMQRTKVNEGIALIGVRYKEDVELQRWQSANRMRRAIRNYNIRVTGVQEVIQTVGVTIKPQALCDLLNERLTKFKSQ